tara:strand:+ start:1928 stop:2302 length:375 start_codon:yes stop_codon:yes gene_type:complete
MTKQYIHYNAGPFGIVSEIDNFYVPQIKPKVLNITDADLFRKEARSLRREIVETFRNQPWFGVNTCLFDLEAIECLIDGTFAATTAKELVTNNPLSSSLEDVNVQIVMNKFSKKIDNILQSWST